MTSSRELEGRKESAGQHRDPLPGLLHHRLSRLFPAQHRHCCPRPRCPRRHHHRAWAPESPHPHRRPHPLLRSLRQPARPHPRQPRQPRRPCRRRRCRHRPLDAATAMALVMAPTMVMAMTTMVTAMMASAREETMGGRSRCSWATTPRAATGTAPFGTRRRREARGSVCLSCFRDNSAACTRYSRQDLRSMVRLGHQLARTGSSRGPPLCNWAARPQRRLGQTAAGSRTRCIPRPLDRKRPWGCLQGRGVVEELS